jgi:transcriptional regulator with XRE-family HTH domain
MSISSPPDEPTIAAKIARLVEERGWNREDLARNAQLNRQTVRQIMEGRQGTRGLRNATISACARALGLPVSELKSLPLERLLPRMNGQLPTNIDEALRRLYERATQPELLAWLERNPERAGRMLPQEIDELMSCQGTGGPLTAIGVDHYVERLERKRELLHKIHAVAGTEYLDLLEKLVQLMYDKVRPYGDRAAGERSPAARG